MTKKKIKNIAGILNGIIVLVGLWCIFKYDLDWYYLLGVLILGVLVEKILISMVPYKRTKKKKSTPKASTKKNIVKNTYNTPHNRKLPDNEILKLPLEKLSWKEVEQLCYLYYKAKGYQPELTKEGADGGVDLIYYHPKYKGKVAVQVKHYINSKNQISVEKIRQLHAAKRNHGCMLAEFITTSRFSNVALAEADKFKIDQKDIGWFEREVIPWKEKESKKKKLTS